MLANAVRRLLTTFAQSTRAGLSVTFAVALPALAVAAAGTTELVEVMRTRSSLQTAVDSAALNGAAQMVMDRSAATQARVQAWADELAAPARSHWSVQTHVLYNPQSGAVTVSADAYRPSFFHDLAPPGGFQLHVEATATSSAKYPLCVLGLLANSASTQALSGQATLSAAKCLVHSNGDIAAAGSAAIKAAAVRSTGKASGNISPSPSTDVPSMKDPFAGLALSVPSACTDTSVQVGNGTTPLNPGVHCGDIKITGNGTLALNPGEHYFVGSTVDLGGNMTLTGSDVVIILGAQTTLNMKGSASISIEGRKSGPYAGFALMTDRAFAGTLTISAKNAKKILGTIYLPNGNLAVDGNGNKVADQSAWTIVVARTITVSQSANLVINSDYSTSTVPVPSGVGPGVLRLNN